MADGRTFTEGEAYALVADAVARETAALQAKVTELESSVSEVTEARETANAAITAAETARDAAVQELADFKAGIEAQKAAEAKRTERLAKLAEVAPTLEVSDERADRIVAMSDEAFEAMVETVRETAAAAPTKDGEGEPPAPTGVPRQSAGFKPGSDDTKPEGTVLTFLGARRGLAAKS